MEVVSVAGGSFSIRRFVARKGYLTLVENICRYPKIICRSLSEFVVCRVMDLEARKMRIGYSVMLARRACEPHRKSANDKFILAMRSSREQTAPRPHRDLQRGLMRLLRARIVDYGDGLRSQAAMAPLSDVSPVWKVCAWSVREHALG